MKIGPRTCDAMALLLQMNSRFYNANTSKILEKDLTSFMDGPLSKQCSNFFFFLIYSATKYALRGFMDALYLELQEEHG